MVEQRHMKPTPVELCHDVEPETSLAEAKIAGAAVGEQTNGAEV
jgi:hypothetical protein